MTQSITNIVKGDLKNYNNFKIRIRQLKEERSMLHHRLMSIGGSGYDSIPGNHESDIPLKDTELIQKITNIDKEIEHYRQRMYGVEVFLDTCDITLYPETDVLATDILKMHYLEGYTYNQILNRIDIDYSDSGLKKRVGKIIEEYYNS